ncbi:tRNA epoxyqueuosine(34) reductase QueG [Acetobacter ghanensis]|uniref:Epoxyqueuosine reductase n=1 Tax=Acetobacter ghanensis TaxID=431306 RepID=A0A0U5F1K6_9PROT|nr:tRNA epoxyqueuosine(34) reductase QueG [Acetobacter ghanensis]NHO39334.1 tRNA epoxyqueuosine(34) reductase QueG [Acetobacter ghanensis]GBQ47764.1 iron-sulfur binding protein [Acetobacter ghanensis DSM 18895]CEF54366.1 iron-sulfur cluster-binding protein [Acetobacter ghanensis]
MTKAKPPPPQPAAHPASRLAERIRNKALELGFDAIGFCPAALGPEVRERLQDFLANGYHGEMGWLAERTDQRSQPTALWPQARTVIALGTSYAPSNNALATLQQPDRGNISVYARHRDYHDVIKGMLKHLAQFVVREGKQAAPFGPDVKVFVDTAPVAEKPLAAQAGLGWQGKHTNLVSRQHGSWLFLGEIYTTLDLPTSPPSGGGCGSCSRCLTACPTQAFPTPYQMDARRCISYLTIEHAGPIPPDLRPMMGTHIYGCDDCLAVCPWNRFAKAAHLMKLQPRQDLIAPELATLSQLDDAAFRTLFSGSPVKRIGRNRFIRNVLIAIGNSGRPSLLPHAHTLCMDPDPVVRDAAFWAVASLERRMT